MDPNGTTIEVKHVALLNLHPLLLMDRFHLENSEVWTEAVMEIEQCSGRLEWLDPVAQEVRRWERGPPAAETLLEVPEFTSETWRIGAVAGCEMDQ